MEVGAEAGCSQKLRTACSNINVIGKATADDMSFWTTSNTTSSTCNFGSEKERPNDIVIFLIKSPYDLISSEGEIGTSSEKRISASLLGVPFESWSDSEDKGGGFVFSGTGSGLSVVLSGAGVSTEGCLGGREPWLPGFGVEPLESGWPSSLLGGLGRVISTGAECVCVGGVYVWIRIKLEGGDRKVIYLEVIWTEVWAIVA